MAKVIILSIVLMSFALPMRVATSPRPKRALRNMQLAFLAYVVIWAYMCVRWYPTLVPLK